MKSDKCILSALAALAAAWLLVSPASAQPDPEGQANQLAPAQQPAPKGNPCKEDVKKLCPEASSFADRMKCMHEHEADLSEACKQAQEQAKQHLNKAREACQSDIAKYCQDVKAGEGRIVACLKGHVDDLTPSCKIAYDKIDIQMQKRKAIRNQAQ
jgi:hypothetical protein